MLEFDANANANLVGRQYKEKRDGGETEVCSRRGHVDECECVG